MAYARWLLIAGTVLPPVHSGAWRCALTQQVVPADAIRRASVKCAM